MNKCETCTKQNSLYMEGRKHQREEIQE